MLNWQINNVKNCWHFWQCNISPVSHLLLLAKATAVLFS